MDWTKMSPDILQSKRTYVQCDDRRPDQTTIYDQESIKYRPPPPFPPFWTRPKVQWAAYSSDHCQTHDFRFARPFKINHRKFKAKPKVQTAKCVAINIIYQKGLKLLSLIKSQFYIQLLYRPHLGTWILPFWQFGQNKKISETTEFLLR